MRKKYDLIVVGTSFSSIFFLKKYLETSTKDVKIAILERGINYPHSSRLKNKQENVPNPSNVKGAKGTYNSESSKIWIFDPNFGGSSNCWTGCTPRFMPNDFNLKSKYGKGVDWPINYTDLENFYTEAEQIMSISGPKITPFPKSTDYPLPPHQLSSVDKVLQKEYGELYISQPTARASQRIGSRGQCCSSSVCGLCPVDSKFTIENSLSYLFEDPRIELLTESQVYQLDLKNDHVASLTYRKDDQDITLEAEAFILGANAIFNAHILLNSSDSSTHLGKGISEQAGTFVRMYLDGLDNLGGSSIITANGFMLYDGEHRKNRAACLIESFNIPFIRNERGKWRQMALFKFIYEDLPSQENFVGKSDDILKPNIVFQDYSDYLKQGVNHLSEDINKIFSFLPIERIEMDGYNQPTEFHICGTTRMSDNPETGVVDSNMIHHKYRNLYILGSSVFPTISPANPTLTIAALSLRAAQNYLSIKPN